MQKPILEALQVSHRFGKRIVLNDVSLELEPTGVTALLGRNGSGKSTLLGILSGVLRPWQGEVSIGGADSSANPSETKRLIGYLPQKVPLHQDLTVDEFLKYCGSIRGLSGRGLCEGIDDAKQRLGLVEEGGRRIGNLSGGYRQRVGLAQAIVHSPALVILDEPTNNLDPIQRIQMREVVTEIGRRCAVIVSTHDVFELDKLAYRAVVLRNGEISYDGAPHCHASEIVISVELLQETNPNFLVDLNGVLEVIHQGGNTYELHCANSGEIVTQLVEAGVRKGLLVRGTYEQRGSLLQCLRETEQT